METLGLVMGEKLAEQMPQMAFPEDHEVVETLGPGRFHEPLHMRAAVRTVRRNRHALHAFGLQQRIQAPSGAMRTPAISTARDSSSMTKNTR
jgi:hypothetical protein